MNHPNKSIFKTIIALCILLVTTSACGDSDSNGDKEDEVTTDQSKELNIWLDKVYERNLMLSPEDLTTVGRKDRQSELNDMSEEFQLAKLEQSKKDLEELHKFNVDKLDEEAWHRSLLKFEPETG